LFTAATCFAAGADNEASGGSSYFEGVWAGKWPGYGGSTYDQDVSITIAKGKMKGYFVVTYAWGTLESSTGPILPGSLKTKGRVEGDKFFFKWKTKQGRELEVTLQKHKDNLVKARKDRLGVLNPGERPYTETYLDRK
jgi:hypothetical protein